MDVGIIGAGRLGQAMARTARRSGRTVALAISRGPESLASVVSDLGEGFSAATAEEAATADIVVIAVPWRLGTEATTFAFASASSPEMKITVGRRLHWDRKRAFRR